MRQEISQLSDEDLMKIAGMQSSGNDISSMSDEDLMKIAGHNSQEQPKISRGEAALETATNVPFAPRIKAAIAAAVASPSVNDRTYGQLYDEALQDKLGKLTQAREQYPVQSFATEVASNLPIPAKGLAGTAALAAGQAIGESKDLTDVGDIAGKGLGAAMLSSATYGLLKGAGKGYEKVFGSKAPKMNADEVRNLASKAYKEVENQNVSIKPEFSELLTKKAAQLDKQTALGKAISGDSAILKLRNALQPFEGKPQTLSSLQELDEGLSEMLDKYMDKGHITKEGKPIIEFQGYLRRLMDNMPRDMVDGSDEGFQTLKYARGLWSKSAKLRDVQNIITRAELSDNPTTVIKNGFKNLYTNPNRLKSFNPQERELIRKAAQSGFVEDSLRTMGSRLVPLSAIAGGGGIPAAMAGQATSLASRGLATKAQLARAEKLAEAIISGKAPMPTRSNPHLNAIIASKLGSNIISNNQQQE